MARKKEVIEEKENLTFERALEGLEKSAQVLKEDTSTLEAAIQHYEEGIKYYDYCNELLKSAKQRIEVYKGDE